jgi:hypothetical protein
VESGFPVEGALWRGRGFCILWAKMLELDDAERIFRVTNDAHSRGERIKTLETNANVESSLPAEVFWEDSRGCVLWGELF